MSPATPCASAPPARFPATGRALWLGILWVLLVFYYFSPVTRVLEPDLDSSIHATYAHFTAHGYQFGSQVNTTAGPYGFVMFGWDYSGELFWLQLTLGLLVTGGLSALILWFLCASPRRTAWPWAWLAAMVLGLGVGDTLFTVTILLCCLFLILNYQRADRLAASLAVAVFLSFLSLIKGTQLVEALGGLLCVAVLALLTRAWRRAGWIAGAFLLGLAGWWLAAGQHPLHLPGYVQSIRSIAQGYNEAMALETPVRLLMIGVALALALGALLLWTAARRRQSPVMLAGCLLLAGLAYVSWKHGYVRSDGHMYIFMDFACIAAFTVPLLEQNAGLAGGRRLSRAVGLGFPLVVAALSIVGNYALLPDRVTQLARNVGPQLVQNVHAVFAAAGLKAEHDTALALRRVNYDLPNVRRVVGRRSIDFFGHEIGLLLLNEFNYQPAPMCCGTYGVYNRHFKELNQQHFLDPTTRPDFILLKLQTIDHRFVAIDDSLSLLAILHHYRPVLIEDESLLLEARPDSGPAPTPRLLATRSIRFDEEIVVPDVAAGQMLLFSFSLPASVWGDALALAYKPPLLFMDLQGDHLTQTLNQRIIASSVVVPSLLNPALENTADLIALQAGRAEKQVRRLRLHTPAPGCFAQDRLTVSFYTLPRPAASAPPVLPKFPAASVFRDPPEFIDPPQDISPMYQDERVHNVPNPTRVGFALRGNERELDLVIGINANAYLQGRVDGVTFTVEIEQPGQAPQLITRRALQPLYVPADRGSHQLRAPLPPTFSPGSRVIVRTDSVPGGGTAWGWAFITHARFVRGPGFARSQFPGFQTLPTAVESTGCGLIPERTRNILMMIPPSTLLFDLPADARELTVTGGLMAGSYANGAQTDGVDFVVECLRPDGSVAPVFNRWLQPLTVPADRGDQAMSARLSPQPPGSRLRLRLTTGPHGSNAWDWAYLSGFELR